MNRTADRSLPECWLLAEWPPGKTDSTDFWLIPLQALVLHVKGVEFLARGGGRHRVPECLALALHALVYVGLVLTVLDPARAAVFVLLQQGARLETPPRRRWPGNRGSRETVASAPLVETGPSA